MMQARTATGTGFFSLIGKGTLLLFVMLMLPAVASADIVGVECTGGTTGNLSTASVIFSDDLGNDFDNPFQDALDSLDKNVFNNILVSGTCDAPLRTNLSRFIRWVIADHDNLRIEAAPTETAILSQPSVACGTTGGTADVTISINDSDVRFMGITIRGGLGVFVKNSGVRFDGVTVRDSVRGGINASGSTISLRDDRGRANLPSQVINNCLDGIRAFNFSVVSVGGLGSLVADNGQFGVAVFDSRVTVGGASVIDSNGWGGVHGGSGSNLLLFGSITNNGGPDPAQANFFFPRFRAGVSAFSGTNLIVVGSAVISNNTGPGILLDLASTAQLNRSIDPNLVNIGMNSEPGVLALHNCTLEFNEIAIDTTVPSFPFVVSGNTTADLECDSSAEIYGDLTGIGSNC